MTPYPYQTTGMEKLRRAKSVKLDKGAGKTKQPMLKEYLFDVKMFASMRVKADSEAEARRMLKAELACAEANLGSWPDGSPILCEISMDDESGGELIEVDGESVDVY